MTYQRLLAQLLPTTSMPSTRPSYKTLFRAVLRQRHRQGKGKVRLSRCLRRRLHTRSNSRGTPTRWYSPSLMLYCVHREPYFDLTEMNTSDHCFSMDGFLVASHQQDGSASWTPVSWPTFLSFVCNETNVGHLSPRHPMRLFAKIVRGQLPLLSCLSHS